MILPSKHLSSDRALLSVGADILELLREPKTISRLWSDLRRARASASVSIPYDWFILALDLLHIVDAIEFAEGRVRRVHQ